MAKTRSVRKHSVKRGTFKKTKMNGGRTPASPKYDRKNKFFEKAQRELYEKAYYSTYKELIDKGKTSENALKEAQNKGREAVMPEEKVIEYMKTMQEFKNHKNRIRKAVAKVAANDAKDLVAEARGAISPRMRIRSLPLPNRHHSLRVKSHSRAKTPK